MSEAPTPAEGPNVIHLPWERRIIRRCPECAQLVVWAENDVLLDWPAQPWSELLGCDWTVVKVTNIPFRRRPKFIAMRGNPPKGEPKGHRLHEHQPPESFARGGALMPWRRPGTDKTRSTQD